MSHPPTPQRTLLLGGGASLRLLLLCLVLLAPLATKAQEGSTNRFNFKLFSGASMREKYHILSGYTIGEDGRPRTAHWSGVSLSFLNYPGLDGESRSFSEAIDYKRSLRYDIGFFDYKWSMTSMPVTFVTGLGVQLNHIRLADSSYPDPGLQDAGLVMPPLGGREVRSIRLGAHYAVVPLLVEANWLTDLLYSPFFVNAGVVGKVLFSATSCVKYRGERGGEDLVAAPKFRPISYDLYASAGVGRFAFVVTYTPTSIFRRGEGPRVGALAIGFKLNLSQR